MTHANLLIAFALLTLATIYVIRRMARLEILEAQGLPDDMERREKLTGIFWSMLIFQSTCLICFIQSMTLGVLMNTTSLSLDIINTVLAVLAVVVLAVAVDIFLTTWRMVGTIR